MTTLSRYFTEIRRVAALAAAIRADKFELQLRPALARVLGQAAGGLASSAHPPEHYEAKVSEFLPKS